MCRLDGQRVGNLPQCLDAEALTVEVIRIVDIRPVLHIRDGGFVLVLNEDPYPEAVFDQRYVHHRIDAVVETVGAFGCRGGQLQLAVKGLEVGAARDVFDGSAH